MFWVLVIIQGVFLWDAIQSLCSRPGAEYRVCVLFAYQIACGRVEVGSIAYGWEVRCDDDLEARPPETEPEWRFSRIIAP